MERVGDMTREELKQLVSEVVEEQLERALPEPGRKRPGRRERLESIRRSSRKLARNQDTWSNPVIEEREALRNWRSSRELKEPAGEVVEEPGGQVPGESEAGRTVGNRRKADHKRSWSEISDAIDRVGWRPPPDAATPLEMLREDRDR